MDEEALDRAHEVEVLMHVEPDHHVPLEPEVRRWGWLRWRCVVGDARWLTAKEHRGHEHPDRERPTRLEPASRPGRRAGKKGREIFESFSERYI